MEALPVFFALNYPNYARRIPILSRYLDLIPDSTRVMFDNNLKQAAFLMAREQANKRVTGIGGMNGLTENPFMLERWILTGPEIQYNISPSDLISLLYGGAYHRDTCIGGNCFLLKHTSRGYTGLAPLTRTHR